MEIMKNVFCPTNLYAIIPRDVFSSCVLSGCSWWWTVDYICCIGMIFLYSVLWMASCLSRACLVPKHFWQLWHLYFSLWIFSCNRNLIPLLNFDPQDGHTCSPQFSWWYLLSACRLKTFWHFSHVGFGWVSKPQSISSRWLCASLFQS